MVTSVHHSHHLHSLSTTHKKSLEQPNASRSNGPGAQTSSSDSISLRSESSQSVTYSDSLQMGDGGTARYGMLQKLVANLLKEQGIDTKITVGETNIDIAAITPEEARDLVSDDGYFGVKQTSERIFQFAVGIAGGDPSRIDAIKEGIDKGFAEAKEAFGGWLPDISYDTYDTVMKKLDDWVAEPRAVA